ncbi:MAG: VWA domain-containing protein [Acidobacteriota bacterium]
MKTLLFTLGVILLGCFSSLAQTEKPISQSGEEQAIRLQANLINLNVKVTDAQARPLVDLKKEDFVIFEDGIEQDVAFFQPVNAPVNLVLLLDFSGSTREKRKILFKAAKKFVDALGKDDQIAVAGFTRKYYLISDFTNDHNLLKKRIDDADEISGGTAYYDALWKTLDLLMSKRDSRKAIVVLTDGVDSSLYKNRGSYSYLPTTHSFEELLDRAEEEDASIYPIYLNTLKPPSKGGGFIGKLLGFGKEMNAYRERAYNEEKMIYALAHQQLEALAESTAGTLFTANREEDLESVYEKVAAELHLFYSLAYAPKKGMGTGEFRKLAIKVHRENAKPKTRKGYFAK